MPPLCPTLPALPKYRYNDLSAAESEVLRKLLNDAVPAQMELKVGDAKSSWEMRALVVSSASPSRERWHRLTPN